MQPSRGLSSRTLMPYIPGRFQSADTGHILICIYIYIYIHISSGLARSACTRPDTRCPSRIFRLCTRLSRLGSSVLLRLGLSELSLTRRPLDFSRVRSHIRAQQIQQLLPDGHVYPLSTHIVNPAGGVARVARVA
jgi:hypothetical protein